MEGVEIVENSNGNRRPIAAKHGIKPLERMPCAEQVFVTDEVAGRFVLSLKARGIESSVLRCPRCKAIHVRRQDG